ncbi:MAG: hypothetical protein DI535_16155 [Citrobacter freundii]|nr:MAG: hypothetical protein DI535_16155 [Citrobacter freundii]
MKKTFYIPTGLMIFAGLLMLSCGRHADQLLPQQTNLSTSSSVQLFNAIVGSNRNFLYVDGQKISGAAMAYGSSFPLVNSNFAVPYGKRSFIIKDTLPATTQVPLNFVADLGLREKYTIFAYDTITAPKYKIVKNDIVIPYDTTARIRFANFLRSNPSIPAVDFYSVKRGANVASGVTPTSVTTFMPYASLSNDTIIVRLAGSNGIIAQVNGMSLTEKRSYTMVVRGGNTRSVSFFPND